MKPYQLRVIDEKTELDVKIAALRKFIESHALDSVSVAERVRLVRQSTAMQYYSDILGARIGAFSK